MTTIIRIIPNEKRVWVSSITLKHLDAFRQDGWHVYYEKEGQASIIEKALPTVQEKTIEQSNLDDLHYVFN